MSAALFRLGKWSYHRRRLVLAGWVVVIAVLAVLAINLNQPTNNSLTIPGTQSQQALDLLNQKFPGPGRGPGPGGVLRPRSRDPDQPVPPPGHRGHRGRAAQAPPGGGRHRPVPGRHGLHRTGGSPLPSWPTRWRWPT